MSTDIFDIQQLVNTSGVQRRTIYFYVQQGLLPPPQGAGLAAFYTREHLLRLQAIPILRRRGLRLDQIRDQFTRMDAVEMQRLVEDAARPPAAPQPRLAGGKAAVAVENSAIPLPLAPAARGWGSERMTQYTLPAGIRLIVPDHLAPEDRRRFEQLLHAARQIFDQHGPQYVYHASEIDDSK